MEHPSNLRFEDGTWASEACFYGLWFLLREQIKLKKKKKKKRKNSVIF